MTLVTDFSCVLTNKSYDTNFEIHKKEEIEVKK